MKNTTIITLTGCVIAFIMAIVFAAKIHQETVVNPYCEQEQVYLDRPVYSWQEWVEGMGHCALVDYFPCTDQFGTIYLNIEAWE